MKLRMNWILYSRGKSVDDFDTRFQGILGRSIERFERFQISPKDSLKEFHLIPKIIKAKIFSESGARHGHLKSQKSKSFA